MNEFTGTITVELHLMRHCTATLGDVHALRESILDQLGLPTTVRWTGRLSKTGGMTLTLRFTRDFGYAGTLGDLHMQMLELRLPEWVWFTRYHVMSEHR